MRLPLLNIGLPSPMKLTKYYVMKFHPLQALTLPILQTPLLFGHNSPTLSCALLVLNFHTKRFILTSEGRYRNNSHSYQNIGFLLTVAFVSHPNQDLISHLQDIRILMSLSHLIHKSF